MAGLQKVVEAMAAQQEKLAADEAARKAPRGTTTAERGREIIDDSMLMIFNGDANPIDFTLPDATHAEKWKTVLDTAVERLKSRTHLAGKDLTVEARSIVLLKAIEPEG